MPFTTPDHVLSINGYDLAVLGYSGLITDQSAVIDVNATYLARTGAPRAYASGAVQPREYHVVLAPLASGTPTPSAPNVDGLLAAIDPVLAPEYPIVATLAGSATRVECLVSTKRITLRGGGAVELRVVAGDPAWSELTTTENLKNWTSSTIDTRQSVLVRGSASVSPLIRIEPTAQRPSASATVGWKWKRQITYTNTGVNNVYRYARRMVLDTAVEIAAGRMQADGDDLRLWYQGEDLPRTFQPGTINTASTGVWFLLPALSLNQSVIIDVMFGNSAAGPPPTLTGDDFPIFDLTTSTNTLWDYHVANNAGDGGLGLWRTELEAGSTNRVRRIRFDVPGAWRPYLLLDNADDKGQSSAITYDVSGTTYVGGRLYATRYRADASSDLGIGRGQGDGIAFYNPLGVTAITASWLLTNPSRPATGLSVGKFTIRVRNTGGEEWISRYDNTTVYATPTIIASATYAIGNNPHVYIGVLPRDEIEIPRETIYNINILARTSTNFQVTVNSAIITESVMTARTEVYDMQQIIRLKTSQGTAYPVHELEIGRESFPMNRKLEIDAELHTVKVFDFDGVTLLRQSPWAVSFYIVEFDETTGLEVRRPARDWFRIRGTSLLPGFGFEDAEDVLAGRWFTTLTLSGLTVTWTRVTTQATEGAWSLRSNITANTGGANLLTRRTYDPYFHIRPGGWVRYAADLRTTNVNVVPEMNVTFYDAAKVEIGGGDTLDDWTPTINVWYGREMLVHAPAGATYYRISLDANAVTAGATGIAYFDNVGLGGADLEMRNEALLTSTAVTVIHRDRWLG